MGRIETSSCLICALVVALASALGVDRLWAQESTSEPVASGPPLQASIQTIRSMSSPRHAETLGEPGLGIQVRFDAFERDFARDFGLRLDRLTGAGGHPNFFQRLHHRMATKWGDTSVYGWIERGVALYAQIEAMTRTERAGFDMNLEVDDVTSGRVGLEMSRSLD